MGAYPFPPFIFIRDLVIQPHVTKLRKEFDSLARNGHIKRSECCSHCGRTEEETFRLELHHIISLANCPPERGFNPNVQENIITLCYDCHYAYHRIYESDYPEEKVLQWIEEVPSEVVFREGEAHKKAKKEKSRREAAKHRKKNNH